MRVISSRVVDVGSEWRTFSNEKSTVDRSRVGATEVSCFLNISILLNKLIFFFYNHFRIRYWKVMNYPEHTLLVCSQAKDLLVSLTMADLVNGKNQGYVNSPV